MKKYKSVVDAVLLMGLLVMSLLATAPDTIVMPSSLQMLLLAVVMMLVAGFLVFIWREQPVDEREAQNQAMASRQAYMVGVIILIVSIAVQGFRHQSDAVEPIALFAMIATKLISQRSHDKN